VNLDLHYRLREIWRDTIELLWGSSTAPVRFGLAAGAFVWVYKLRAVPDALGTPVYKLMNDIAPAAAWAAAFTVYGVLGLWRVYERWRRPRVGVAVNALGFVLYAAPAYAMTFGTSLPAPAGVVIVAGFAFWVLLRTAINDGWTGP